MRKLIEFFLRRKLLVNLLVVIVVISGLFSFSTIRREALPNVDIREVLISTIYPGASPKDVELNVTIPIEDALQDVEGIDQLTSASREGFSIVGAQIDDTLSDKEADDAKDDIQKALDRVKDLPAEVPDKPIMTEIKASAFPIVEIMVIGPDEMTIRGYVKDLEKKIKRIPEVSYITKVGFRDREIRVEVDPNKLISTETAINDIVQAIRARNVRMTGGTLESFANERNIVTIEEFQDPAEVKKVIIRSNFEGQVLRVRDVAKVVDDFEKQTMIVRGNGQSSISLAIHKKSNADVLRTLDKVTELLETDVKPKGVSYILANDMSVYTRNRLKIVTNNAIFGIIMVFATLMIFMNFRTAVWTAFGIPFSLLVAFILLPKFGLTINLMSLAGFILILGMLVDDAIVVAENIQRHREEGQTGIDGIVNAVMEIIVPVATTITTTIIAFAPLLFVPGVMGKFMYAVPTVIMLALSASFIESIFVLPSHLSHGDKEDCPEDDPNNCKPLNHKKKEFVKKLQISYEKLLIKVLAKKYMVVAGVGALLIVMIIFAMTSMQFLLRPKGGDTEFYIKLYAPKGTSMQKMEKLVQPFENAIQGLPENEFESLATRIGTDSTFYWINTGSKENYAIIFGYLTPMSERDRYADEIVDEIKAKTKKYQKNFDKVVYESHMMGPRTGKPVSVRLLSNNDKDRLAAAAEMQKFMEGIPGVIDIDNDNKLGKDEVKVDINFVKLAQLGLSVQDVAATLRTAYDGMDVTSVREDDEDVEFRIQLAQKYRRDKTYLLNLPVRNQAGKLVRLKRFAKLSQQHSASDIDHYERMRSAMITGEIKKGEITPLKAMLQVKKYLPEFQKKFPGVFVELKGEGEQTAESFSDLGKMFIVALIGIYFMLILMFNDFLQPLFVMSAIPLSMIGVILAFALHGAAITFQAVFGFVGLAGVVVNDSLIMVSYINRLHGKHEEKTEQDFTDSIVRGAVTRLRPIILTTITTVVGVMPMIYGWGGRDEYVTPIAMTLGYGLLGGSFLTLFIVPCLLKIHRDFHNKVLKLKNKLWEKLKVLLSKFKRSSAEVTSVKTEEPAV
ncbi:efflux RND transporter permease subunit [Candidatus Margulisiibacteriota bacterium]